MKEVGLPEIIHKQVTAHTTEITLLLEIAHRQRVIHTMVTIHMSVTADLLEVLRSARCASYLISRMWSRRSCRMLSARFVADRSERPRLASDVSILRRTIRRVVVSPSDRSREKALRLRMSSSF